jgi:hypothetical protein
MTHKEPFAAALRRPAGMISAEGFKDDPRWRGNRLQKPDVTRDIVLRPSPNIMGWAIVAWGAIWAIGYIHPILEPFFPLVTVFFIMYMLSAIPKLFLEKTIITPSGIERVFGPFKSFFMWEKFHTYTRDGLGVNLRMVRPWGIWMDEYNLIVSNLFYSSEDVMKLDSLLFLSNGNGYGYGPLLPGDEPAG